MWSFTFACGVSETRNPRANVKLHVPKWSFTCGHRTPRANVKLHVSTWSFTCGRGVSRSHVEFCMRTWNSTFTRRYGSREREVLRYITGHRSLMSLHNHVLSWDKSDFSDKCINSWRRLSSLNSIQWVCCWLSVIVLLWTTWVTSRDAAQLWCVFADKVAAWVGS